MSDVVTIKWKVSRYSSREIDQVECVKETAKSVWIREYPFRIGGEKSDAPYVKQQAKCSEYTNFFDSWEDAHTFILGNAELAVINARRDLAAAHDVLGNIKGMRPPGATRIVRKK